MTNEQIQALAREYAEGINPVNQLNDYPEAKMIADMMRNALSEVTANQIKDFEGFLRFLLHRFCLVEKECVNEAYKGAIETIRFGEETGAYSLCTFGSAKRILLESFFPELGKEAEG